MKDQNKISELNPYSFDLSAIYRKSNTIFHAIQSNNLVFFVGSGVSKAYNPDIPNWSELLNSLLSEVNISNEEKKEEIIYLIKKGKFSIAAEAIKKYSILDNANKDLAIDRIIGSIIEKRLKSKNSNDLLHLAILDFGVPIITTNYDPIFEDIINKQNINRFKKTPITYTDENQAEEILLPQNLKENYIFKIHGTINQSQRLIIDESDYLDFYFYEKWPRTLRLLRHIFATKMVIFIGFSISDPELLLLLRESIKYSSSYQHIAIMHEDNITEIENELLKSNYRIEPILYKDHSHLPLLILETRNMFPKESLPLSLTQNAFELRKGLKYIKKQSFFVPESTIILFGSFAKYGVLSTKNSDLDLLIISNENYIDKPFIRIQNKETNNRQFDIVIITRTDFELGLKVGDPFICSVLTTGCPIEDSSDIFGTLARGFRPNYNYESVKNRIYQNLITIWLRLCVYKNSDNIIELYQAYHRFCLSAMQLFLIEDFYSIESVLSLSLLGNSRFTLYEFDKHFKIKNKFFFSNIIKVSKREINIREFPISSPFVIFSNLFFSVNNHLNKEKLGFLQPSKYILKSNIDYLVEEYNNIKNNLDNLSQEILVKHGDYGETTYVENELLTSFNDFITIENDSISICDYLFFFNLHNRLKSINSFNIYKFINTEDIKEIMEDLISNWEIEINNWTQQCL